MLEIAIVSLSHVVDYLVCLLKDAHLYGAVPVKFYRMHALVFYPKEGVSLVHALNILKLVFIH